MKIQIRHNSKANFTVLAHETESGQIIYLAFSYETLIGVALINPQGDNLVMITNVQYSKTTVKHCKEFAKLCDIPYNQVVFISPEALHTWNA